MPILTRFLMLLATVPLLLPPGVCVCKAGDGRSASGRAAATAQAHHAVNSHAHAGCSHARRTTSASRPVADRLIDSTPAPVPHDDHHNPGCPAASAGVERLQGGEPTAGTIGSIAPAPFAVVLHLPRSPALRLVGRPAAAWPSSPPLYLSYCSLLI